MSRRHRHITKRRLIAALGLVVGLGALGLPSLARTLRVGVSGSAPFVIEDALGEGLSGISVEVWRRVAEANDLPYDFIRQASSEAGIAALEAQTIDVLVGPVSITASRLARPEVDFTQPYHIDKAACCSPCNGPT